MSEYTRRYQLALEHRRQAAEAVRLAAELYAQYERELGEAYDDMCQWLDQEVDDD